MTTSTISRIEDIFENFTTTVDLADYPSEQGDYVRSSPSVFSLSKWILRLTCVLIMVICPWANYKLIQLFQTRPFYKDSSSKWYLIFKAIFDTVYMYISIPIIFSLTFYFDIIHKNIVTCKLFTYVHYLADDIISITLALLCIDRMIRLTCGYRLRPRFSLIVCLIAIGILMITNLHHFIRLKHADGFCQKTYFGIWDYDFDIYYSFIYTSVSWTIIFISSINSAVSICCDRTRRKQLKQQQQQISKTFINGGGPTGSDSDRVELIRSTDEWEDTTTVVIEQSSFDTKSSEQVQEDNIDLQITKCVLITAATFLLCNLPNFIIFIRRFIYKSSFTSIGYIFIYLSIFPLFIAHTASYFVFNHLAARFFSDRSS